MRTKCLAIAGVVAGALATACAFVAPWLEMTGGTLGHFRLMAVTSLLADGLFFASVTLFLAALTLGKRQAA